ncbi:MAG: efflux RND transporter periplasmic adaptor subunit [Sphingobacteriia bacterium]
MKKWLRISLLIVALVGASILIYARLESNKAEMEAEARIEVLEKIPVKMARVTEEKMSNTLQLVGTVEANRTVRISSEATGKVERIFFDEGTYVAVGTPLLKLNDEQIRANLVAAKANYEKARKDWERVEALAQEKVAPGQQLDDDRLMMATPQSQ